MRHFPPLHQLELCALFVWLLSGPSSAKAQAAAAERVPCPDNLPIRFGASCLSECPTNLDPSYSLVEIGSGKGNLCLRETSSEIANEVCSIDDPRKRDGTKTCAIQLIRQLSSMNESTRCRGEKAVEALILQQEINDMVLTASLQADGFTAEIDTEIAQIRAVHDELTDQQNKAVQHSSFGGALGSGAGAVGSALALVGDTAATVGNYFGAAGGGLGTFFGFLGYFQQKRGPSGCFPDLRTPAEKVNGEKIECDKLEDKGYCPEWKDESNQPLDKYVCGSDPSNHPGCSERMLYELLCRYEASRAIADQESIAKTSPVKAWWFHSQYDPAITAYLQGKPPGSTKTRSETLMEPWKAEARDEWKKKYKVEEFPKDQDATVIETQEAYLLAGNTDPRKLSIDQLTDRTNKLADLRAVVSRMNRDLSRLTEDLAMGLRCH